MAKIYGGAIRDPADVAIIRLIDLARAGERRFAVAGLTLPAALATELAFGSHGGRPCLADSVVAVTGDLDLVAGIVAIIAAVLLTLVHHAVTGRMSAFLLWSGHVASLTKV